MAAAAAHAAICWHMASSLVEREPPEHCSISLAPEVLHIYKQRAHHHEPYIFLF